MFVLAGAQCGLAASWWTTSSTPSRVALRSGGSPSSSGTPDYPNWVEGATESKRDPALLDGALSGAGCMLSPIPRPISSEPATVDDERRYLDLCRPLCRTITGCAGAPVASAISQEVLPPAHSQDSRR